MKKYLKIMGIVALIACVGFMFTTPGASAVKRLRIATAGIGGTWYPLGGGVAKMITKYISGVEATAYPSGASVENIRAVSRKRADLALVMPDAAYYAYTGTGMFKGEKVRNIRGVCSTYPIDIEIIVAADSPIKKFEDIKGHSIACGAPGSGIELMTRRLLKVHNMSYDDVKANFLSVSESMQAFKDGTVDVIITSVGTPSSAIMDLVTKRKIRFLDISDAALEKINKILPVYFRHIIPAGTYKGINKDCKTLAWMGFFITYADMDNKLVYSILDAIFSHKPELNEIHSKFKLITLKTATNGISIPLHPGAEKFYKDKGVLK